MFGYVLPHTPTLEIRDFSMFQATFCGICITTKHKYGQLARLTTNYDMTLLHLLAIEAIKPQVEFATGRCILDPRKRVYIKQSELSSLIVDINILLCHYKLQDDLADGGGKKRFMRHVLKKPYEAARQALPECDRIIDEGYAALREMERNNVASLDRTSHCFATILERLFLRIVSRMRSNARDGQDFYGSAENRLAENSTYVSDASRLCYNIGKFVYLSDALDDLDEDSAKHRYNPFLAVYPDYERGKRKEYIEKHGEQIRFAFNSTVNRAIEIFNCLPLTEVGDLLRNIVHYGLRAKLEELLTSEKKLPPPRVTASKEMRKKYRLKFKAEKLKARKEQKTLKQSKRK